MAQVGVESETPAAGAPARDRAARPAAERRAKLLPWVALGLVYVVWGSTYLGIRVAVETLPPLLMSGLRFLVAGLVMFPLLRALDGGAGGGRERLGPAQWGAAAVVGALLLGVGNGGVSWAEQRVHSGLAALLVATAPLWFVVFDRVFNGARVGLVGALGVVVGLAGVAVLVRPGGGDTDLLRTGMILVSTIAWTAGSLYVKRAPLPRNSLLGAAMQMLCAGVVLLAAGVATGELDDLRLDAVSGRSALALGYLTVIGSVVGYTAYNYALRTLPTATVSTYAYVNPVIAVALGVLILSEPLTAQTVLGGLIIVAAVGLIVTAQRRRNGANRNTETAGGSTVHSR